MLTDDVSGPPAAVGSRTLYAITCGACVFLGIRTKLLASVAMKAEAFSLAVSEPYHSLG